MWAGSPEVAEAALRESCQALESIGDRTYLTTLAAFLAEALYMQGKLDEAEQWTGVSETTAGPDDLEALADWRCVRAKILARHGRLAEAHAMGLEALDIVERTGESDHKGDAYLDFAEVCRPSGKGAEERHALGQAISWYESKGNVVMAGRARSLLHELASRSPSVRG